MKKLLLIYALILFAFTCKAQTSVQKLQGKIFMAENFEEAYEAFLELEKRQCAVDYYPLMASKAMEYNHRKKGVQFLDKALRAGYTLQAFESRYYTAYSTLSSVTKDSLLNYLEMTNAISFNWQKRQVLEGFFMEDQVNEARQECDTNQRIMASGLRNLLNQYMRTNGLPSDCEVGLGMQGKSVRMIFNRSHLLFESEWQQIEEILTAARENYQISGLLFASLVDTHLWLKYRTSRYGSFWRGPDDEQVAYIKAHLEEINAERKAIGLYELSKEDF